MRSHRGAGVYEERTFPRYRTPTVDSLRWGRRRHHVPLLLELDVTAARDAIRRQKAETGRGISLTAWIIRCVAQAVSEHPHVHALRKGRRKLVIFHDVDVAVLIERTTDSAGGGETLPMPYVVRRANEKSLGEIHEELRGAQQAPLGLGEVQVDAPRAAWMTRLFTALPRFARDLAVWRPLHRRPLLAKRRMGTVCVTAVGMMGHGGMSWGVPAGLHALVVAVGGIAHRPALVEGRLVNREHVGLTVLFDHEVVDGAPVARFIARLQELMNAGHGLETLQSAPIPEVGTAPGS